MSRLHIRPASLLLAIVLLVSVLSFVVAIIIRVWQFESYSDLWLDSLYVLSLCILIVAAFDYLISRRPPEIRLVRKISGSIAVNKWSVMTLKFEHNLHHEIYIELCDLYSSTVEFADPRLKLRLVPGETTVVNTKLRALARGDLALSGAHVRLSSRLKMWQFAFNLGEPITVKVYPDFEAVVGYTLLAIDNHTSQLGIRAKQKRGEGLGFLQLREYRAGDTMRQIDWKATSRRQQLISKEYQDERDQHVILLLDSGRQMRAKDGALSHFDHALNASLLLSYIALRQGDSVSAMSFGNMVRWIPPHKGAGSISSILNSVYDLHSGVAASDYVEAARSIITRQRKRSLVVLITNSRGEQLAELVSAVKLLRRHHLVLLANIHEQVIAKVRQQAVTNFDEALRYSAIWRYQQQHKQISEKLRSQSIYTLDCEPQQLAVQVTNSYLGIKRAGAL